MRLAIFSDVHANLPALRAVLSSIDAHRPDQVFCLGDLVGYAPWPNEVVAAVRRRNIPTIAGNYDEAVGRDIDDCGCAYQNDEQRARGTRSIGYTNDVIADDHRRWLRSLPRHLRLQLGAEAQFSMLFVHGSPRRINEYLYEDRPASSMARMMEHADADALLFGHTHVPYHRIVEVDSDEGPVRHLHAINTGSVGKPKDGDPRACWAMVDVDDEPSSADDSAVSVRFVRVSYDVECAVRGIEESPLPDAFAEMLRSGRSDVSRR